MQWQKVSIPLAPLLFLGVFSGVYAHGTGLSYEVNNNGYAIDIGYDERITALESSRFDFVARREGVDTSQNDEFTDVWVTFSSDSKLYFGGAIHKSQFGSTGFTYVFPEAGTYTVSSRYEKDGETVAKAEFQIDVAPPLSEKKVPTQFMMYSMIGFAGLLLGVAGGLLISQSKK
jgi:hypothetical protein